MFSKVSNNNKVVSSCETGVDNMQSRQKSSEFRRTFSVLFAVMMLYGLDVGGDLNPGCFRKFYTTTVRILVIISQTSFGFLNIFAMLESGTELTDASYHVTLSLIAFEVVLIYIMFSIRLPIFKEFVNKLEQVCQDIIGNQPRCYRPVRMFIIVSVILTVASVLFMTTCFDDDDNFGEYFMNTNISEEEYDDELWCNYYYMYRTLLVEACILRGFLFLFSVNVTIMVVMNFTLLSRESTHQHINDNGAATIRSTASRSTANRPASTTFLRRHDTLCSLVRLMDSAFQEIFIICNVSELASVIFILRALDFGNSNLFEVAFEDLALAFLSATTFVVKSACAAAINEQVMESMKILTEVDESSFTADVGYIHGRKRQSVFEKQQEIKCRMYARYVKVDAPTLTGCGFYAIRKGFVLVAAGNAVTYVLVLYNAK